MNLKCQRCNHIWDYQGDNPYYATCPYCKTKVKVVNGVDYENYSKIIK